MAIGRISGSVLKSNLTRNGTDLAFETNLLYLDVTNSRIGIGTSEPTTALDVSGTVKATAFTGDGSGLTGINVSTNIQIVGDDSTGAILGTGETFKIAGTQNITTAVSGDTLTITGPDLSNYLQNTGTQTIDNLTFNDNIIGTSSNANLILDPGGTGVIEVKGSIVPNTDLTLSLGSPAKRFQDAYFGSGTVYIGDNSITSTDDGIVFSAPISTTAGTLTRVSDDNTVAVKEKIGIRTEFVTIDSFDTSTNTSALYYALTNDEVNQELTMSKVLLTHDTSDAYISSVGHITGNQNSNVTFSADVDSGSVRLRLKGNSQINSTKFYKIPLGSETTTATSGRTATVDYGTLVADSSTYNVDSWAKNSARAVKYIISSKGLTSGNTQVDELLVVHNGTNSSYTRYNFIRSDTPEPLAIFTTGISGDNVVLQAYTDSSESVDIKLHKIILSDDDTAATFDNVAILPAQAVSSTTTTIDSFEFSKYNGAFYLILGSDSTNGMYSISEVYVSSDETDAYVSVGPTLTMDGNEHLSFTVSLSGSRVLLKCASDTGSTTNIVCYRIGLYRGPAGGDFTSSVTLDTEQTISGAKTFTAGVLTDTIQSPSSNADLTIDASGTGAVQILTQKVIMANLPTSDPSVVGQLWNNAGVLNISAG
jgi:hypothetical protein